MSETPSSPPRVATEEIAAYIKTVEAIEKRPIPQNLLIHHYKDYDELTTRLNFLFELYNNKDENLQSRLDSIRAKPETGLELQDSYLELRAIAWLLSEQINSNFEFKLNENINSLSFPITRKYLTSLKARITEGDKWRSKAENISVELEKEKSSSREILEREIHLKVEKSNLERHIEQNIEALANAKTDVESFRNAGSALDFENTTLKAELSRFKEATQKTEIARNSTNFHNQAEKNKSNARIWMSFIFLSILGFISFLFYAFANNEELFNVATGIFKKSSEVDKAIINQLVLVEIGKKIGTKLLIFSLIIYLISFLVKNYNAQMHNYVVNSHKANALRSTVDLIGTAKQDDGNDKIILQATQAIFTSQKSGYQGAESEPTSPNLITNVIDAVSGGKKG